MSSKSRADKAIRLVKKQFDELSNKGLDREFDSCFEGGDGGEVVFLFMEKYFSDDDFKEAVEFSSHYININSWSKTHSSKSLFA